MNAEVLPGVRVVNIERIFPNRIVIHVSKRVPVYLMKYRQNTSDAAKYVVVDGDMVVLGFYDDKPDEQSFVFVDGFELVGKYAIETGRTLPVEFGKSIYYLQNVAAGLYNCKLTPAQFIAFIEKVRFENDVIDLCTRSGVVMRLGGNLTTEHARGSRERCDDGQDRACEAGKGAEPRRDSRHRARDGPRRGPSRQGVRGSAEAVLRGIRKIGGRSGCAPVF